MGPNHPRLVPQPSSVRDSGGRGECSKRKIVTRGQESLAAGASTDTCTVKVLQAVHCWQKMAAAAVASLAKMYADSNVVLGQHRLAMANASVLHVHKARSTSTHQ